MEILYWLESIRMPVLNECMLIITYLGDQLAFLAVALILYWCVDKRKGCYVLFVGFFGTIANQFMKLCFRIPRPWERDSAFTIVDEAKEAATGYSFPSGHTQNAVGTFGCLAITAKKRWRRFACIAVMVLVPFSRMYLGVHTLSDVVVAAALAVVLIFVLKPLVLDHDGKYIPILLGVMTLMSIAYLCYVEFFPFPADMEGENLSSGRENAYRILGALLGFLVAYPIDQKWLRFPVKAVWWAQILKTVIGLALVMAVMEGLSEPLAWMFGELPGRLVRYFLVVIVAGLVWPLTFRWFAKIGKKE